MITESSPRNISEKVMSAEPNASVLVVSDTIAPPVLRPPPNVVNPVPTVKVLSPSTLVFVLNVNVVMLYFMKTKKYLAKFLMSKY